MSKRNRPSQHRYEENPPRRDETTGQIWDDLPMSSLPTPSPVQEQQLIEESSRDKDKHTVKVPSESEVNYV